MRNLTGVLFFALLCCASGTAGAGIPPGLAEALCENGMDVTGAEQVKHQSGRLVIAPLGEDPAGWVVQLPGGGWLAWMEEPGTLIRCDTAGETCQSMQVSPECIKEISSAVQALLSAGHNCVYDPRPFKCAEDLLDFVTCLYLAAVECSTP